MPYLQANSNTYFGFMPAVEVLSVNAYAVSSSEGAVYAGDVVVFTSICTAKSIAAASTGNVGILGVAANYLAANAGSTGQFGTPLFVYDHPDQIFACTDTTSGSLGSTGAFKSYGLLATGCIGSSGGNSATGRGVMAISAVTASSGGAFRHMGLHPVEQNLWATATTGLVKRHLAKAVTHYFGNGAMPGAVTT